MSKFHFVIKHPLVAAVDRVAGILSPKAIKIVCVCMCV